MTHFRTMLKKVSLTSMLVLLVCFMAASARADDPAVLGDLDALSPEKLSKAQLEQLLPNAKMSRIAVTGSTNVWTNETDGTFVISTNNKAGLGGGSMVSIRTYTAPGNWHVSEDGRYCVKIQWKSIKDEEWCRFVFKTSQGYFASNSDQNKAAKVYKLVINGN